MTFIPEPRIVDAQRMRNGVLVVFDDDTCAFYSALLLHATLPQAEQFPETAASF